MQFVTPVAQHLLRAVLPICLAALVATIPAARAFADDFIVTPFNRIPNFGAHPTVVSAHSGAWSSPSSWLGGRIPATGDIVSVEPGSTIVFDVVSDAPLDTVVVQPGGHLTFRSDVSTRLTAANVLVLEGAELQIGTATNPVAPSAKAEIVFPNVALDTGTDPEQYGHGLIVLGKVTMHGAPKNETFERLAAEPKSGDTTLTLSHAVTGWRTSDRLVLPDTRQHRTEDSWQTEVVTLGAVSSDGKTLSFSPALQFDHLGARDVEGHLDFLAVVGNLTRNVSIRSADARGTRGYTLFTRHADVDIRYTAFQGLGRTTNELVDGTTFDQFGNVAHLGTNQGGRTPVTFDHLIGPATVPADGYQFTFIGNTVMCPLDPMPFRWGVTLNDSHYGLIKDNVVYNWAGAAIVSGLSGSETSNTFAHNFVVKVGGTGDRGDGDGFRDHAREGTGMWFGTTSAFVRDNVVADASTTGYFYYALGQTQKTPAFQGADPTLSGQFTELGVRPISEFSRNEAFGSTGRALQTWSVGANVVNTFNIGESLIEDFHAWHVILAYYGYPAKNVTFNRLVVRGDQSKALESNSMGLYFGDYLTANNLVESSDIQGVKWGLFVPPKVGDTSDTGATPVPFVVQDSYLRNYYNVTNEIMYAVTGGYEFLSPRRTIFKNVRFAAPLVLEGGRQPYNFVMSYFEAGQSKINLIGPTTLTVYDYNGVPGDDFEIFFHEQVPDFIVPQTGLALGSPEAGLTNQENWARHGIAISGGIARCNDTSTRPEIFGITCPLPDGSNHPPSFNHAPDQSVALGSTVSFAAAASDRDGDQLTFTVAPGAPPGATIDPHTGRFTWTPAAIGDYHVTLHVDDDGSPTLGDTETIAIAVTANGGGGGGGSGPTSPPVLGVDTGADISAFARAGRRWHSPKVTLRARATGPVYLARHKKLRWQWQLIAGPGAAKIRKPRSASTSVSFSRAGDYAFQATVWDSRATATAPIQVHVLVR